MDGSDFAGTSGAGRAYTAALEKLHGRVLREVSGVNAARITAEAPHQFQLVAAGVGQDHGEVVSTRVALAGEGAGTEACIPMTGAAREGDGRDIECRRALGDSEAERVLRRRAAVDGQDCVLVPGERRGLI